MTAELRARELTIHWSEVQVLLGLPPFPIKVNRLRLFSAGDTWTMCPWVARDRAKFLENGAGGGGGADNMKKRTLEISD